MKKNDLSDQELLQKTEVAAKNETDATLELLKYLVQIDERRAYATLACSSLFEYVNKILGYSEMQTSERVNSVRLMRAVPEAKLKIQAGHLSMSTASKVHRFLKQEQKGGKPKSNDETIAIIEKCSGQSKREVEKTLFAQSSDEALVLKEQIRTVSDSLTEIKFLISDSTFDKLQEVKNLIGNDSLKDLFDQALDALLAQTKKKKGMEPKCTFPGKLDSASVSEVCPQFHVKPAQASEKEERVGDNDEENKTHGKVLSRESATRSRFIPISIKRVIISRSGNQCEFIDEKTKQRCTSKYQLQFDHYPIPFAQGGKNDAANLRNACFQHNQKWAMEAGLHFKLAREREPSAESFCGVKGVGEECSSPYG
jgi:hypothetical protein